MEKARRYLPLFVMIMVAAAAALALSTRDWSSLLFMPAFMGMVLVQFALLKLINLPGFVKGYRMYDLPTRVLPAYAWVYPFIELGLGLAYLNAAAPTVTNTAMLLVAALNTASVVDALRRGVNINCACVGTTLNVPLTTVSATENIAMGLMAAWMLLV